MSGHHWIHNNGILQYIAECICNLTPPHKAQENIADTKEDFFARSTSTMQILSLNDPDEVKMFLKHNKMLCFIIRYVFNFSLIGNITNPPVPTTKNQMLSKLIDYCNKINQAAKSDYLSGNLSKNKQCMEYALELVHYINENSPVPFDRWIMDYVPLPQDPRILSLERELASAQEENARLAEENQALIARLQTMDDDEQVHAMRHKLDVVERVIANLSIYLHGQGPLLERWHG